jgi:hypothetical protein
MFKKFIISPNYYQISLLDISDNYVGLTREENAEFNYSDTLFQDVFPDVQVVYSAW